MGYLKGRLRARIATRGDVEAIQADLGKLRRRVEGLPDLKEFGRQLRDLASKIVTQDAKLTKQDGKLTKQDGKLTKLDGRLAKQESTLATQSSTQSKQGTEILAVQQRLRVLTVDYERMAQQLAATETRIEWLRDQIDPEVFSGTSAEHAEARSLIDEIRREHDQVRIRFQVVSNYEERLSRVEEILARAPQDARG